MTLVMVCTGFEAGVEVTGNAGNRMFDAKAGAVDTTNTPRTGSRCLEVTASASAAHATWNTSTFGSSQNRGRAVFAIRFVGSLPAAANSIVASFTAATTDAQLKFFSATGKLGVAFESSAVTDGPVVVADTWYVIEMYADFATGGRTIDWWVDGVAQPQATTASSAETITGWEFGCSTVNHTYTIRYDDAVVWTDNTAISGPQGPHKVVLLTVDTADTVTLSGTTANFNTFTNNGTLAAWNATTARNNIDETPPNFGGTADGWVQITAAASDYVQMPMTTYALQPGETVAALRMLIYGWATSTTAANIGFRSWNGTTETILWAVGDPNFDNASTSGWVCKMCTLADFDTQTELDALAFRGGFSTDATPDMGVNAIYGEVAIKEADVVIAGYRRPRGPNYRR